MKKYLFTLLCLLALRLQANPAASPEPIGQRLGMSLIEVIDSISKEGTYHYLHFKTDKRALGPVTGVVFADEKSGKLLTYVFDRDKCVRAKLVAPMEEFETMVVTYDLLYTKTSEQTWQSPYGRIALKVMAGQDSPRYDHQPQLTIDFTPAQ